MSFWTETPNLSTLIHDTNNRMAIIGAAIDNIDEANEQGDWECINRSINSLRKQKELLKADIDEYYKKVKQQYDQAKTTEKR